MGSPGDWVTGSCEGSSGRALCALNPWAQTLHTYIMCFDHIWSSLRTLASLSLPTRKLLVLGDPMSSMWTQWLHHWRKCLSLHEQLLTPALKWKGCRTHPLPRHFFWNISYTQPNKNKGEKKTVNKPLSTQVEMIINGIFPEITRGGVP